MRIMLGAGLIKIRGDRCWIDLTCNHFKITILIGQAQTDLFNTGLNPVFAFRQVSERKEDRG